MKNIPLAYDHVYMQDKQPKTRYWFYGFTLQLQFCLPDLIFQALYFNKASFRLNT